MDLKIEKFLNKEKYKFEDLFKMAIILSAVK